jgi:hypothetical protein
VVGHTRSARGCTALLASRQRDPLFLSQSGATILLGRDFVIRAANPAYTASTERGLDELLSVNVFDAFPDNPEAPEERATQRLAESVEAAFRTAETQYMPPLRYDIPDPRRPGQFVERRWMIVNTPVVDGDDVIGASVRGHDITTVEDDLLEVVSGYRDAVESGDLSSRAARQHLDLLDNYLALADSHANLVTEVSGLRRAMESRAIIEQAKGMVMADRRCTADEAFDVLRRLSMDTNVRLADVAATIVHLKQQR